MEYWLLGAPLESSGREMVSEMQAKLSSAKLSTTQISNIQVPEFKTATLSNLLTLSEMISKQDSIFISIIQKVVDTIQSLDPSNYNINIRMDDGRLLEAYLMQGWNWDKAKYRAENRPLIELLESFMKDMNGIDAIQKQKQSNYNLVKGQLQTIQRKQTGNLATRDLATVIDKEDVPIALQSSEYMEIIYVAVPKNSAKDWENKYERLTQMVVPRSSVKLATDDEFHLYSVTIFKKVKDEFLQKCREEKFTVRDFTYDQEAILKQQAELKDLQNSERELWAELLRISRINYSEGIELLAHLKVLRAYVECLLRYGLPAAYFLCFLKPGEKNTKKLISTLTDYCKPFTPTNNRFQNKSSSSNNDDAANLGEYASLLEAEYHDFVLYTIPPLDSISNDR